MDEYTPTEREVRIAYNHWGKYPELAPDDFDVTEAEFDRWLAEHDRVVAANAWDEGAESASSDWYWHYDGKSENPYRITEEN